MQRVRLLGELGERFGAEYTYYNLRHPADAIKLLCINRPDFKDYLLKSEENGIGFRVIQAEMDMDYPDLLLPFGQNDLVIAPVLTGSGDSFGKILAGIGLIALSFISFGGALGGVGAVGGIFGGAAAAGAKVAVPFLSNAIFGIGASLVLGGVAQLISPQPQLPSFGGISGFAGNRFGSRNRTGGPVGVTRGTDGQQSYAYTGAANTVGVGATVPLAYGKVLIGSHLLRSKVEVTDESDPTQTSIKQAGPDTFLVGGEKITADFNDVSGAVVKSIPSNKTAFATSGAGKVNNSIVNIPLLGNKTGQLTVQRASNTIKNQFNVAFDLKNGLFNYAGGFGTTYVDAFITYEVNVYAGTVVDQTKLVALDQVTIQGLLIPSKNFTWMHRMELPSLTAANLLVQVKIIDTDAYSQGLFADIPAYLRLLSIGYLLT